MGPSTSTEITFPVALFPQGHVLLLRTQLCFPWRNVTCRSCVNEKAVLFAMCEHSFFLFLRRCRDPKPFMSARRLSRLMWDTNQQTVSFCESCRKAIEMCICRASANPNVRREARYSFLSLLHAVQIGNDPVVKVRACSNTKSTPGLT